MSGSAQSAERAEQKQWYSAKSNSNDAYASESIGARPRANRMKLEEAVREFDNAVVVVIDNRPIGAASVLNRKALCISADASVDHRQGAADTPVGNLCGAPLTSSTARWPDGRVLMRVMPSQRPLGKGGDEADGYRLDKDPLAPVGLHAHVGDCE